MSAQKCPLNRSIDLALYWAIRGKSVAGIKSAIRDGADKNAVIGNYSMLSNALWFECWEEAKELVLLDADVNFVAEDYDKSTPLTVAGFKGAPEWLVEMLLDRGADKRAKDSEGDDAFANALITGNEHLYRILR